MMDKNQICDNLKKDDHADYETFTSIDKTGDSSFSFGEH